MALPGHARDASETLSATRTRPRRGIRDARKADARPARALADLRAGNKPAFLSLSSRSRPGSVLALRAFRNRARSLVQRRTQRVRRPSGDGSVR